MHKHSQSSLPLIGITGRARSGKDTIGSYLLETYAYHRVSFAEPLRRFVCNLIGIDRRALDFVKEDPVPWLGKSPRQMLQTMGTEWGRMLVNENIWVLVAMDEVRRVTQITGRPSVITDVRFDNEADAIRQRGGRIIHVARPDAVAVAAHASEAGVHKEHGDFTVINDGSLTDLYAKVDEIMETL